MSWKVSDKLRLVKGPFRYGYKLLRSDVVQAFEILLDQELLSNLHCRTYAAALLKSYNRQLPEIELIEDTLKSHYRTQEIQKVLNETQSLLAQKVLNLPKDEKWLIGSTIIDIKIPRDALLYLAQKGTPLEFRIILFLAIRLRKNRNFVMNMNQYLLANLWKIPRETITRAVARLKQANIIIDLYTPLALIRTKGKNYTFSSNASLDSIPKYQPKLSLRPQIEQR